MLFQHNGGPAPSTQAVFFPEDEALYDLFDLVSVDQRGFGVSSFELLYPDEPAPVPESGTQVPHFSSNPQDMRYMQSQSLQGNGPLAHTFSQEELQGLYNSSLVPPCHDLYGLLNYPPDWTDYQKVKHWVNERMKLCVECSSRFDKSDGLGGTYNVLQYMGTAALVHDVEWMRWALGAPKITLLGFSYGTRLAAAYAGTFPDQILRVAVSGVMAPTPDAMTQPFYYVANNAQVLGSIQNECSVAGDVCMQNPFSAEDGMEEYFDGDLNDAVKELFNRSRNNGAWYQENGCNSTMGSRSLSEQLERFLEPSSTGLLPTGTQNNTWPWGFGALPTHVFWMVQNPCRIAMYAALSPTISDPLSMFYVSESMDVTGKWSLQQVTDTIVKTTSDVTMAPITNDFISQMMKMYSWPQYQRPVAAVGSGVSTLIAQGTFDSVTGVENAQVYQRMFPNSTMVNSVNGGHAVSRSQGTEAFLIMMRFIKTGVHPEDGYTCPPVAPIDFKTASIYQMQIDLVLQDCLPDDSNCSWPPPSLPPSSAA